MVDTMRRYEFRTEIQGTITYAAAVLGMLIVFPYFVLFEELFDGARREGALKISAGIFLLMAPSHILCAVQRFRVGNLPTVEISNLGVLDRRYFARPIPWNSIISVQIHDKRSYFSNALNRRSHFLVAELSTQKGAVGEAKSKWFQRINLALMLRGRGYVPITSFGLKRAGELKSVVATYWAEHERRRALGVQPVPSDPIGAMPLEKES